ncbi:MAG: AI-2E family transporter [Halobacteriovoraceae bacterium]|nr:AI-2E family transporter [Halobacteriovoraceae bacterium]
MLKSLSTTKRENFKLIFFFGFILLSLITLTLMPRVSIPLVMGYVIYLIVSPAVPTLEKIGLNRTASIWVVFSSLIFFSTYPFVKIVPAITAEVETVQTYLPKVESYVKRKYGELQFEVKDRTSFELGDKYFYQGLDWVRGASTNLLLNVPKILASLIEWIFLVPLIIFFLLKDGGAFKKGILNLTPNSIFERFYFLSHQFNKKLGDYIFAKFVEASIVGITITSGLLILNVRFALLFGIISAITNIIPYVGPVIGFVPALLFSLVEYGSGTTLGAIIMLFLVANAIDIAIVFPILVSKVVDLHPLVVVVSVILGSQWLGMVGMIISIPFAAALKLIFQEIYKEIYQE